MAAGDAFYQPRNYEGTEGIFSTRRKHDLSDKMIFEDRTTAAFLNVLSRNLTKQMVKDPEPKILNYVPESNVFGTLMNASAAGTGTRFDIADAYAQQLQVGDDLLVVAKTMINTTVIERVTVTAVGTVGGGNDASTQVTVARDQNGVGAINIVNANFDIVWAGNSVAEGEAGGYPIGKEPGSLTNYTQTFEKTIGETRTRKNTDIYAKMDLAKQAKLKRELLMEEIELAFFLGSLDKETVSGKTKRWTRGVLESIPADNKQSLANLMSPYLLAKFAEEHAFAQGNKRNVKWWFVGGGLQTLIDGIFYNDSQIYKTNMDLSKYYGYRIKTLSFGAGDFNVVKCPAFRGTGLYSNGFIIDMDYVAYMYLQNSDLQIVPNTESASAKWNRTEWKLFGELGLMMTFLNSHLFTYGATFPE